MVLVDGKTSVISKKKLRILFSDALVRECVSIMIMAGDN